LLSNKQEIPASIIVTGQATATVANRIIADVAEVRKDVIVCVSPLRANVVNNAGSEATSILSWADTITRSTYAVADSGWKYQYDKYNDTYVYVPLNADTAGCMARNDAVREPWLSPAGFNNGRIQNLVRLAFNPNQADRDTLYKAAINPVITQVGQGTVLFGDKTFTLKNTSMNRVNVRRLFIELQKTIGQSADNVLFDQNDATTRNGFVSLVVPYLRSVQSRRGITAFRVVCDESNNPEDVVNANEFVCDIFVQPIRSVNFIQLNFVSVRGTATFAEIAA
jgi:phage tail sheath protein FI